jgi:hypothetical protein
MLKSIRFQSYSNYLGLLFLSVWLAAPAAADELSEAQAKWAAANISDYRFTLTKRVMWGATSIVLIEVRGGKLVAADHIIKRTNPVPDHAATAASGLRKSLDELLTDIATREDFVEATFNLELGYPIDIYYQNPDFEEAVDQLEIRDFAELTDGT